MVMSGSYDRPCPVSALAFPRRTVFKKSQSHIPYLRTVPGTWHQLISTRLACLIVLFATLIVSVIGGYFSSSVSPHIVRTGSTHSDSCDG
jgi:hypothetical protein